MKFPLPTSCNKPRITQNNLFGIWDLEIEKLSIGGGIIFIEELNIFAQLNGVQNFDICIVGDFSNHISPDMVETANAITFTKPEKCIKNICIKMLLGFKNVSSCKLFKTYHDLLLYLEKQGDFVCHPEMSSDGKVSFYDYSDTTVTQEYYTKTKQLHNLSLKTPFLKIAYQIMNTYASDAIPISIHLKNSEWRPGITDWYNAILKEWEAFFKKAESNPKVKFFLIGNDPLPDVFSKMQNVIITNNIGSNLLIDLAIIQLSYAFLGVASGPCQMAIYNEMPYVIYKNPEGHQKRMQRELGDRNQFSFSSPYQKLLREHETGEGIFSEYNRILSNVSITSWRERIHNANW